MSTEVELLQFKLKETKERIAYLENCNDFLLTALVAERGKLDNATSFNQFYFKEWVKNGGAPTRWQLIRKLLLNKDWIRKGFNG